MKTFILNEEERMALFSLSHFAKFGPEKMKFLFLFFRSYQKILNASSIELGSAGIKDSLITDFINWREYFNLQSAQEAAKKENIGFITWHDKNYPFLLKEISFPPSVLFFKGNLKLLAENCLNNSLAVVGSRKHSQSASGVIDYLLPKIIASDIVIISGLALGVDFLAHKKTVLLKGKTIAVLGTGLSEKVFYPKENKPLSEAIIKNGGLIISEFPPLFGARARNFPQRNRLISGLSKATLIIEAPQKSGAMITASRALEQNREVLAIPGDIFSDFHIGNNYLIKSGAKTITSPDDVLEIYEK